MDEKFADRMAEVGQIDAGTLAARWTAVEQIVAGLDNRSRARLVLIACRAPLNREADGWFWRPFRDIESTFRVDDAVELHARLAESVAREAIYSGDQLIPVLVELAVRNGLQPTNPDLTAAAKAQLVDNLVELPAFSSPKAYWTRTEQKAATAEEITVAELGQIVHTANAEGQAALSKVAADLQVLQNWATNADHRLRMDQSLVEWLIAGVRSDGAPWTSLDAQAIAIDAASELSDLIPFYPLPQHEGFLVQVLATTGVAGREVEVLRGQALTQFEPCDDALAELCPLTTALANRREMTINATEFGRNLLWELCAQWLWTSP